MSTRTEEHLAHLEVKLPYPMVVHGLRQFAPLKIHLTDPSENRRWIELDPPSTVEFRSGVGIHVVTTGRFRFDIAKIPIPAQLNRVEFLILPRLIPDEDGVHLAIPIEIESADVRMVPDLIDSVLVSQVNAALTPKASQLMWQISDALSAVFQMPKRLDPLESLELKVVGGDVNLLAESLTLRIDYEMRLDRSD